MKKIIIGCMLLTGISNAQAQTTASQAKWESSSNAQSAIQQDNEFANTEMNVENGRVTFSELPELKKATWAIVTDAAGAAVTQKRIAPNENTMDLHRLQKGEMYFVTLVYKNKSKKGFVLHL